MVKKKLVSIIIRGKNEAQWLKILFKELKKQTVKNFEIIFCDNNSEDETLEILKANKIKKIIKFEKYIPGEILNRAIRKTNSKYICILSAHCIPVNKYWLEEHINSIQDNPKFAASYGKQIPLPGTTVQNLIDLDIIFKDQPIIYKNDPYLNNANAIYKSNILKKNLFNPKLTNIEDRIWAKNMIRRGYEIFYSAKASVFHLHGVHQHESKSKRALNTYNILVNKYKTYWKKCDLLNSNYYSFSVIINGRSFKNKIFLQKKLNLFMTEFNKLKLDTKNYFILNNSKFSKKTKNLEYIKSKNTLREDLKLIYKKNIHKIRETNYIIYFNLGEKINFNKLRKLINQTVYYQYESATFGELIKENFLINFKGNEEFKSTNLDTIENKPSITLLKWSKGSLIQSEYLRKGVLFSNKSKIFYS